MPKFTGFQKFLTKWYRANKRDHLAWRKKPYDPYRIWVSEIMLQQTQVSRVVGFYQNFIKKFPTVQKLAKATWTQVLSVVRGMGYYSRFRNMRLSAKTIVKKYQGKFPNDFKTLRALPGIGAYTANAILCFAFGQYAPMEDTNIRRIFNRLKFKISLEGKGKIAKTFKDGLREFFYALMDFGSLHLTADHIGCKECGLFFKKLPRNTHLKAPKKILLRKRRGFASLRLVAAAVIHQNGKILIQKRNRGDLASYWEFPGGKVEKGETARQALKREIQEELGIEISVRPHFFKTSHITFHRSQILLGKIRPLLKQEWKWVFPQELDRYRFPPADKEVLRLLQK